MSDTNGDKQRVLLTDIRIDGGTQARVELRHVETIEEYAEKYQNGVAMPELIAFLDDKGVYWLADGFQRFFALQKIGKIQADCIVREGSQRDAILFSLGTNDDHGLKRTSADKRKAVATLLTDKEWGDGSDRQIATLARVSQPLVSKIRAEMAGTGSSSSEPRVVKCANGREMRTDGIAQSNKSRAKGARIVEGEFSDDSPEDDVYERDEQEAVESDEGYGDEPESSDGEREESYKSEASESEAENEGCGGDGSGEAFAEAMAEVPKFKEIIKELGELRRRCEDLHAGPAGHRMAWGRLEIEFKNIVAHIKDSIPVAPCEVCNGDGCKECLKGGFIVESYAKSLKKTA